MVVYFDSVKSVQPKPFATNWDDLKERLMSNEENAHKSDGALWSPVEYYQVGLAVILGLGLLRRWLLTWMVSRLRTPTLMGLSILPIQHIRIV